MSYIIVCVKQVPDIEKVQTDRKTGTLIRSGIENTLNPYDSYAMEAAAGIKDENPDIEICALSMGPPQAESCLRDCMARWADTAVLISDPCFAGSDTCATGRILAAAVKKTEAEKGPCLGIFCGRQAVDGDTAQVGPELAERLGLPVVSSVLKLKLTEDGFEALQEDKSEIRRLHIKGKCLFTFTKPGFEPRQATLRRRMRAAKAEISVLDSSILSAEERKHVGINGSPTAVIKTESPVYRKSCEFIEGSPEDIAEKAAEIILCCGGEPDEKQ